MGPEPSAGGKLEVGSEIPHREGGALGADVVLVVADPGPLQRHVVAPGPDGWAEAVMVGRDRVKGVGRKARSRACGSFPTCFLAVRRASIS